jgi:hypothetical protein
VALCDVENYQIATDIILKLFDNSSVCKYVCETSEETLTKAIKLLDAAECIENVKNLFQRLVEIDNDRVKMFAKNFLLKF